MYVFVSYFCVYLFTVYKWWFVIILLDNQTIFSKSSKINVKTKLWKLKILENDKQMKQIWNKNDLFKRNFEKIYNIFKFWCKCFFKYILQLYMKFVLVSHVFVYVTFLCALCFQWTTCKIENRKSVIKNICMTKTVRNVTKMTKNDEFCTPYNYIWNSC